MKARKALDEFKAKPEPVKPALDRKDLWELLRGEDGKTPVKGEEYMTEEDINEIANRVISLIELPKNGLDGLDGKDGVDGKDGRDGKDVDEDSVLARILPLIRIPEDGKDADQEAISKEVFEKVKKQIKELAPDDLVSLINESSLKIKHSAIEGLEERLAKLREENSADIKRNIRSTGGQTSLHIKNTGANVGQVETINFIGTTITPVGDGREINVTVSGGGGGAVDSVNGQTGVVVLDTSDIAESGNLYFTDERAQDAVGTILTDTSEINFTYDDATPSITASIVAGSIDEAKLDASVNASLDLADSAVQDLSDLGVTASAAELNILDGATLSTTELNYVDGVTSAIQTQLNGKQGTITLTTTGSSGAATLIGNTLNIPQYSGGSASPLTTKGDLYTYSTEDDRLPVGTNGYVLTADSGEATGLKWAEVTGTGTVTEVSGTTNRISVATGTTTPVIDIDAAYVGQSSITTLGTVTTGTWGATTIALNKGGTGQTTKAAAFDALSPMSASGDVIYGGASGTGTRLAKGTDGQVLTLASGVPSWATPTTGTVTAVSIASANGFAGSSSGGATPALTISTSITGVLKGNGTAISAAAAGTDYEVPLTFSTGLTRSTDTITVNTTQNIAKLSNLTSNGFVKTSGGDGTLSIDTSTYLTTSSAASTYQPLDSTLTALAAYNTNGILTQTAADTFTGRTITGTSNRLTVTNGDGVSGNPTLDISSSYVGQASITTLGTIATGVWNGTDIAVADGGTGVSSLTAYAVICGGTTSTGAVQSVASVGTAGHVLTSNGAGALPSFQAVASGGLAWTEVTGTSQSAAVNNGYITNNASLVTVTIPTTAPVGSIVRVAGKGAGGWKIAQNASEIIHFGNQDTTTGTGGSLASVNRYDAVEIVCIVADTEWVVLSSQGNITVV